LDNHGTLLSSVVPREGESEGMPSSAADGGDVLLCEVALEGPQGE